MYCSKLDIFSSHGCLDHQLINEFCVALSINTLGNVLDFLMHFNTVESIGNWSNNRNCKRNAMKCRNNGLQKVPPKNNISKQKIVLNFFLISAYSC